MRTCVCTDGCARSSRLSQRYGVLMTPADVAAGVFVAERSGFSARRRSGGITCLSPSSRANFNGAPHRQRGAVGGIMLPSWR